MDNFIMKRTPKGFEVYKTTKNLLGKEKMVDVSKNEFFDYSSKYFKETGEYIVYPNVKNMEMATYLKEKAYYNNKHFFSDFNMRTTWLYNVKEENVKEYIDEYEDDTYYLVKIVGNVRIYSSDSRLMLELKNFEFEYLSTFKYSKRYIELLMQNACNGIYQSARDIDEMYKELYTASNNALPVWCCSTCTKVFMNLDEFYSHLIEEEHMDGIFTEHPFDEEVQRIKRTIQYKIKNHQESST